MKAVAAETEGEEEGFEGRSWETMAVVEGAGSPIVRLALISKRGDSREDGGPTEG